MANTTTRASDEKLREALKQADQISQETFEAISGIAQLILIAMRAPDGRRSFEAMARCVMQIEQLAETGQNEINCVAEEVGCNYSDEGFMARLHAQAATVAAKVTPMRREVAHA